MPQPQSHCGAQSGQDWGHRHPEPRGPMGGGTLGVHIQPQPCLAAPQQGQTLPTKVTCAKQGNTGGSVRRHRRFWHVRLHVLAPKRTSYFHTPAAPAFPCRGRGTQRFGTGLEGTWGGGVAPPVSTAQSEGWQCWDRARWGRSAVGGCGTWQCCAYGAPTQDALGLIPAGARPRLGHFPAPAPL